MPGKTNIALLVPCYNASTYINDFLTHISGMEFTEVIFYNDGSTDDTLSLLKNSGHTFYTSSENHGPGFARNQLAARASADYIHFHDIDDRFNPDFIQLATAAITTSTDVAVGNADWVIKDTGATLIEWRYDATEAARDTLAYFIKHPLGIINTVYKRAAFLSAGGFNTTIKCWEDSDLHIRMAFLQNKFAFIDHTLAYSVRHNKGVSADQDWCWECRLEFLQSYLKQFPGAYTAIILSEIGRCAQIFYNAKRFDKLQQCLVIGKAYNTTFPLSQNIFINLVKKLPVNPRFTYDIVRTYQKLSIYFK